VRTILITGSRKWTDEKTIEKVLKKLPEDVLIIHGGATGADQITDNKCKALGIPTKVYRPVKESIGAYYLHRNAEMVGVCDEVIAFWDGESRGTKFTIDYAEARGKLVTVYLKDN